MQGVLRGGLPFPDALERGEDGTAAYQRPSAGTSEVVVGGERLWKESEKLLSISSPTRNVASLLHCGRPRPSSHRSHSGAESA